MQEFVGRTRGTTKIVLVGRNALGELRGIAGMSELPTWTSGVAAASLLTVISETLSDITVPQTSSLLSDPLHLPIKLPQLQQLTSLPSADAPRPALSLAFLTWLLWRSAHPRPLL